MRKKNVFFTLFLSFLFCFSFVGNKPIDVKAAPSMNFDENGITTLGYYFQTIETEIPVDTIKTEGTYDNTLEAYSYNGNYYAIIDGAAVDNENEVYGYLSNGSNAYIYRGTSVAIKYEPIQWKILKQYDNYADLVPTGVLDRIAFHGTNNTLGGYIESDLCTFLNTRFLEIAFKDHEREILLTQDNGELVSIPSKDVLDEVNLTLDRASDYAILNNLSNHETYANFPYWTSTLSGGRVKVAWNTKGYTDCLYTDPKIGVLPVIRVPYEGKAIAPTNPDSGKDNNGGGSKTHKVSNVNSGTVKIIIGGTIIVISIVLLSIFFKKWMKNVKADPSYRLPKWKYSYIAIFLVVCITGTFLVGTESFIGTSSSSVVGWYQGNMYDCVEWGERLAINLTRDGKVYRYVGDAWADEPGSATNWTFIRQDGVGSYSYSGGKLTINAAPEWRLSSWELPTTVYTDCHGLGSFIKYEGYEGTAYSWYHYSTIDSNGIASIKNNDTRDNTKWG